MGCVNFPGGIFRRSRESEGERAATAGPATAPGAASPSAPASGSTPPGEQNAPAGAAVSEASAAKAEHADGGKCPECGASMAEGQQWCTQCGERSDGSMRKRASWASAGALTIASAILASGAAAAGVAALNQGSATEPPHRSILAQTPVTTSTTTPAVPPAASSPGSPETLTAPHTSSAPAPAPAATVTRATSTASANANGGTVGNAGTGSSTASNTTPSQKTTTSATSSASEVPELQGLTASAYSLNPQYPKDSLEGPENDPMRALEGPESGTSWTVHIKSGTAENLNVGLAVALGGPTRVGSVEVHTSTPGFPVEIYGATSSQPPAALGEWQRLALTPNLKASATLKLGSTGTHWRYVLLWLPKVAQGVGHVALGEVALFPPA